MDSRFNVRYVLVSDYAAQERGGKIIIAGLYTEDIMVESLPANFPLNITVVAKSPDELTDYRMRILDPSGKQVISGQFAVVPGDKSKAGEPRSIVGFGLSNFSATEAGIYKLMVGRPDGQEEYEIHSFGIFIGQIPDELKPGKL